MSAATRTGARPRGYVLWVVGSIVGSLGIVGLLGVAIGALVRGQSLGTSSTATTLALLAAVLGGIALGLISAVLLTRRGWPRIKAALAGELLTLLAAGLLVALGLQQSAG